MEIGNYYIDHSKSLYKIVGLEEGKIDRYLIVNMTWLDEFGKIDEEMWKERCSKILIEKLFKPLSKEEVNEWLHKYQLYKLKHKIDINNKTINVCEKENKRLNKELKRIKRK